MTEMAIACGSRKGCAAVSTAEKVMELLEQATETTAIRDNPDLDLFRLGLLDSLGTVQLMVALSETFGIEISPAEVDRDEWATPLKIISYIQRRISP